MTNQNTNPENAAESTNLVDSGAVSAAISAARDLSALSSVEILSLHIVDLMTAAAVKLGEFEGTETDLAEARILINALAGLIDASAPDLGSHHAAPMRDGLQTLQRSFRERSLIKDEPGMGPGEQYTGPVY
ncbi:MAG: DUF1844 domain-containing protein [Actinomycetales bacterium]|nr:DUF1844 domain-containing protein [Actinomycetales bacterium]